MSRYIERKVVINKVNEIPVHFNSGDIRYGIEVAIQAIKDTPTADVAEVKHGHWIDKNAESRLRTQSWCSACGKRSGIGGIESNRHKAYCPNCGAKMDGERKDEE